MSDSLRRVGLIGCGDVARRYASALSDSSLGLQLERVTDADIQRALRFAADHDLRADASVDDLLAGDVALVCVCTPNATHAAIARRCLEAGKDVIVEHPMAMSTADADRLIATAVAAKRRLFVVRQRRFLEPVQTIRGALSLGHLGMVRDVDLTLHWSRRSEYFTDRPWRRARENGGVVANQASHFLDLLLYLFGDPIEVSGVLGNVRHDIDCEDSAVGRLRFADDFQVQFECTIAAPEGWNRSSLTIHTDAGAIVLGGRELDRFLDEGPLAALPRSSESAPFSGGDHRDYLARVAKHLAGDDVEIVDGAEGARSVRLIETIYSLFRRDDEALRAHFDAIFAGAAV